MTNEASARSANSIVSGRSTPVERKELSGEALHEHVRQAAHVLLARLKAGEAATNGWQDELATRQLAHDALNECLATLAATNCWGEANRLPSSELWHIAGGWLQCGELLKHARLKPRGYAGDYDLLGKICDDWRCAHPLGSALDDYFQQQAAPRAVRHRTQIVSDAIIEACRQRPNAECHVVSIGSGPARDVESALQSLSPEERRHVRVTLLDLDPHALDQAAGRLAQFVAPERLLCARENLFRLAKNSRVCSMLFGAHVLSCVGFFDYLSEPDAAALLAVFWKSLAPGGRLLVFNFTPVNPSRALMEWIGNWYLVYRDLGQLAELGRLAGIPVGAVSVDAEELGVDAFLAASTPKV